MSEPRNGNAVNHRELSDVQARVLYSYFPFVQLFDADLFASAEMSQQP